MTAVNDNLERSLFNILPRRLFQSILLNYVLGPLNLSRPIVPLASTGGYSLLPSGWSTEARCRTWLTRCGRVLGPGPLPIGRIGESAILAGRTERIFSVSADGLA